MRIKMILAISENNVIGDKNRIPWRCSTDMMRFKTLTLGKKVVMGHNTYKSIQSYSNKDLGVLPGRKKIVFTHSKQPFVKDTLFISSMSELVANVNQEKDEELWIIGGKNIYEMFVPVTDEIYLSIIHQTVQGDTLAPALPLERFKLARKENHFDCTFFDYVK